METSTLFQRLGKPYSKEAARVANPFTFGAGGWQLSEEATELLAPIFSFDYMGDGRYEFGAVPNALNRIAKDSKDFVGFMMEFPQREVARHWREEIRTTRGRPPKIPPKDFVFPDPARLFMFCHKDERVAVENIVSLLVSNRYDRTRDSIYLHCALRPHEESDKKVGWLELNNGYFIFVDREAWKKTITLFKGGEDADVREVDNRLSGEVQDGHRKEPDPLRSHSIRPRVGRGKSRSRVRDQRS